MGYKEAVGQELNLRDPFQRHKFRPLIPKFHISPNHHIPRFHGLDIFSLSNKNHLGTRCENTKEEGNTQQVMVSTRWNPTPEQLSTLEELYRCGTRTPSAEQIQHITAQLRRYGKIEGKNVFYWFQNHKARERQKRRRQLQLPITSSTSTNPSTHLRDVLDLNAISCKDKGIERDKIVIEVEHKDFKWTPSMNKECEPPIQSTIDGPKKADSISSDGWIQFHETAAEFQHNNNVCTNNLLLAGERNATWHTRHISMQPFSCTCYIPPLYSKLIGCCPHDLNHSPENASNGGDDDGGDDVGPTLQLFPESNANNDKKIGENSSLDNNNDKGSCMDATLPFYKFL